MGHAVYPPGELALLFVVTVTDIIIGLALEGDGIDYPSSPLAIPQLRSIVSRLKRDCRRPRIGPYVGFQFCYRHIGGRGSAARRSGRACPVGHLYLLLIRGISFGHVSIPDIDRCTCHQIEPESYLAGVVSGPGDVYLIKPGFVGGGPNLDTD